MKKQSPGAHQVAISAVAWYPIDNGIFLSGSRDGQVKVWDSNTLQVGAFFAINHPVFSIAMSPIASSHCLVAVGSSEADVLLCDVVTGGFSHRLSGHRAGVWAVAWSPSKEWELISGGRDGQIRVWDIRQAGSKAVLDMHNTKQRQAPQGGATRGGGGGWGMSTTPQSTGPLLAPGAQSASALYVKSHESGITGITSSPDGLYWISAGNDDRVRLWDAITYKNELVHYNETFNRASKPRQIATSDDGRVLFHPSGSAVQVFDVHSGHCVTTLGGGHFECVNCSVWNATQEELYTGSNDHHIVVWAPKELGKFDPGGGADDKDGAWSDKDTWSD